MPIKLFILSFCFLGCFACSQNKRKDVPKVLENKKTTIEKATKRGEEDLVDGLYNEAVNTNEYLKKIEADVQQLQNGKADSLSAFGTFDDQNKKFYNTALKYAEGINDSTLKHAIKMLISSSLYNYDSTTNKHDSLLKNILTREATLKDLRSALKIIYTLPLIKKYQEDNLPSSESIEGFSLKQDEIIKLADTLIKNNRKMGVQ